MFDDEKPVKKSLILKDLAPLSIDELEAYIVDLDKEIDRTKQEISKKQAHKNAAASFFKN